MIESVSTAGLEMDMPVTTLDMEMELTSIAKTASTASHHDC
jgi:hypothetical protein